ncbi:MAG: hypothetical protein KC466_14065, partial [Myxococcales bacterium]|nr:hypothetical protein [Myxococcales bacterium]
SLRALATDGLELLGVESSKTRKLVGDLIATLSRLGLNTPSGFARATRGGGGGGILDTIASPFEDLFSFGAPGRSQAVGGSEPTKIELHFHSVVADRRSLDRHVREEVEPRLRALAAGRTPARL